MSRFIESIGCFDGKYALLEYHQQRVDRTFASFFPDLKPLDLQACLPQITQAGKVKVRLVYDNKNFQLTHESYQNPVIQSLKLMQDDDINYPFKYENRERLQQLFQMKDRADDVLIVKGGCITDSYYANVCLWDGHQWFTPETCLLPGVRRQSLLDQRVIKEAKITTQDLINFEKISLINALNDLGEIELFEIKS